MKLNFSFKDNRDFIKNILLTTVFGAVISFLNYLFNVYLARNFSEYNFNIYNAAIGIFYLIQIPAIAIQAAITKKAAENRNFDISEFKRKSILQFTIIGTILSVIFYSLRVPISEVAHLPVEYMLPLTVALFSSIVSPIAKGFLLAFEKILAVNVVTFLETILKFGMGIIAIKLNTDITLPILANCVPALLSLVIILPFIKPQSKILPKDQIKIDYKNLLLIFITFFLINTPYTLDLVLVNPENRASYGALSLLGKIVYFASITIASVMFSRLANQDDKKKKETLTLSLVFTLATGLSLSLIYSIFGDIIVNVMYKGMYTEIVEYAFVYGIAMTIYAASYMIINYYVSLNRFGYLIFLLFTTCIQIILFIVNNNTLYDAYINQIIVYVVLFSFVLISLIFSKTKNVKQFKKRY